MQPIVGQINKPTSESRRLLLLRGAAEAHRTTIRAIQKGCAAAVGRRCASVHGDDLLPTKACPVAGQREDYLLKSLGSTKIGFRFGGGLPVKAEVALPLSRKDRRTRALPCASGKGYFSPPADALSRTRLSPLLDHVGVDLRGRAYRCGQARLHDCGGPPRVRAQVTWQRRDASRCGLTSLCAGRVRRQLLRSRAKCCRVCCALAERWNSHFDASVLFCFPDIEPTIARELGHRLAGFIQRHQPLLSPLRAPLSCARRSAMPKQAPGPPPAPPVRNPQPRGIEFHRQ